MSYKIIFSQAHVKLHMRIIQYKPPTYIKLRKLDSEKHFTRICLCRRIPYMPTSTHEMFLWAYETCIREARVYIWKSDSRYCSRCLNLASVYITSLVYTGRIIIIKIIISDRHASWTVENRSPNRSASNEFLCNKTN